MKRTDAAKKKQGGFTLIELSIVLVISGLVTVIIFDALHYKAVQENRQATLTAMDTLDAAFTEFVGTYGYYPCPSDITLRPNDPNYGKSQAGCAGAVVVAGKEGHNGNAPDNVYIGGVPFVTMAPKLTYTKLSAFSTQDGWGRRIAYAVTGKLTASATYDPTMGAIDVVDENKVSVLNVPNTAHMVLISYGDDGRGAYTGAGTLVKPCGVSITARPPPPPAGTTAENELENCDNTDARFLDGLRNLSEWSYNDDIVRFSSIQVTGLWQVNGTVGSFNQVVNANLGNVGIGTDNPAAPLDVAGKVSAAQVLAAGYCDQTGANCLPPVKLGGNDATMNCPAGQAVVSIELNKVNCAPVFPAAIATACPPGQYMNAVSNLGNVKCITFP